MMQVSWDGKDINHKAVACGPSERWQTPPSSPALKVAVGRQETGTPLPPLLPAWPQLIIYRPAMHRRQALCPNSVRPHRPATAWMELCSAAEAGVPVNGPPTAALHRCHRHPDKGFPQRLIPGHSPGGTWQRSFWPTLSRTVTAGGEAAVKTPGHQPPHAQRKQPACCTFPAHTLETSQLPPGCAAHCVWRLPWQHAPLPQTHVPRA